MLAGSAKTDRTKLRWAITPRKPGRGDSAIARIAPARLATNPPSSDFSSLRRSPEDRR